MSRRPFIISSLDNAEKQMFNAFLVARDNDFPDPLFVRPHFFKPAYAAHVDIWGHLADDNTDLLDGLRKMSQRDYEREYLNSPIPIYPTEITPSAYDGSNHKWQKFDELSQWNPLWQYTKIDLTASIKKLLRMDVLFAEDHKKLLEWLKTRGLPVYLSGPEYHNLTNQGAYRGGFFLKPRRYLESFLNASFTIK